jgi:hypothetical protein
MILNADTSVNVWDVSGDLQISKIIVFLWVQGRIQDLVVNNVTKDWARY